MLFNLGVLASVCLWIGYFVVGATITLMLMKHLDEDVLIRLLWG